MLDIYTYTLFAYGLTALISMLMAGLIVIVNKVTRHMQGD